VLTPFGEGKDRGYIVSRDVALFQIEKSNVMQEDSMERKPLHYTFRIELRVAGARRSVRRSSAVTYVLSPDSPYDSLQAETKCSAAPELLLSSSCTDGEARAAL
jgi:hypothetical protein